MANKRKNIHVFMNNGVNSGRLFKEIESSIIENRFNDIEVLALWSRGLKQCEISENGLVIKRLRTILRILQSKGYLINPSPLRYLAAAFGYLQYMIWVLFKTVQSSATHVSVHNLSLLPAATLAQLFCRIRLIYVPHELETERTGLNGFAKRIAVKTEAMLIGRCNAVVVVCEPIAAWYRNAYKIDNVFVVRNLPRRADVIAPPGEQNHFRRKFTIPAERKIFIYQGLIDSTRGISALLETFTNRNDHIVFMGFGDLVPGIIAAKSANIHYHPAVPLSEIKAHTSSADVGLIIIPGKLTLSYQQSLPNKFFEYLHAGIPIIVSANLSYMASIIREHGLGWVVEDSNFSELLDSINNDDIGLARAAVAAYAKDCVWENDATAFDKVYADD